jgi:hypothetical protein
MAFFFEQAPFSCHRMKTIYQYFLFTTLFFRFEIYVASDNQKRHALDQTKKKEQQTFL